MPRWRASGPVCATRRGNATTAGYGPRFLHSTGQLHKGGAPIGWFLQLTADHPDDRADPRLAVHLRAAHRRPGRRRPRRHRVPRPADPAGPSRRRPGRRAGRPRARADRRARPHDGGLTQMRIGFIGLGRMGANMVRRLVRDGHEIVVYNRTPEKSEGDRGRGRGRQGDLLDRRPRRRAREAARGLGHGPGRRRHRGPDRRAARAPRAGRHDHRRRQHQLPRRRPAPRRAQGQGHPLRRCRDVGRDLGAPGRLLPDGRRRRRPRSSRSSRSSRRWRPRAATCTSAVRAPGTT